MRVFNSIIILAILLWVFLKTISYSKWTWDRKNRLGAIVILMIALAELILPVYSLYFGE